MYYVYVIKSKSSGKIYIGQTNNIAERLKRHNGQLKVKTKSYTYKNKGPWKLLYKEEFKTRSEALIKENYLKSHHGRNWLKGMLGP